ncbi:MAG: hypothetical protein ACE5J1_02860 [Nitrospiria bacterium]
MRLTGPTDVTALEASINEIIRRQEILRVSFSMQNEQPLQVIAPSLTISFLINFGLPIAAINISA